MAVLKHVIVQVLCQKKRFLHALTERFTKGPPRDEVLVAWGGASTGHGSSISRRCALAHPVPCYGSHPVQQRLSRKVQRQKATCRR